MGVGFPQHLYPLSLPPSPICTVVPDLSVLDAKVVQVLALQRLQQLLSNPLPPHLNSTCEPTTATPPVPAHRLEADVRALKEQEQQILNGWSHTSAKTTHQKKGKKL